ALVEGSSRGRLRTGMCAAEPEGPDFRRAPRRPSTSAPQRRRDGNERATAKCCAARFLGGEEERESADKPGSVESSHSSALRVTAQLKRPTGELVWAHLALPYSVLLRVGFTVPQRVTTCAVRSYRTFSPLPAVAGRRYVFCGTFRRLAPPRRYLAPCPAEPGLSSEVCNLSDCLADSQFVVSHFVGRDWRGVVVCDEVCRAWGSR